MKNFITKEGLKKLKEELNILKRKKRQEIAKRIGEAKEMGDLSENAEYAEAKEAQSLNEQQIAELEQTIRETALIDETRNKTTIVQIGSTVTVKNNDQTKCFTIVGSSEANPSQGKVSNESPLGAAFLNHKIGDDIEVKTPGGTVKYKIIKIE